MINEFYVFAGWQQDEIIGIVYREPANNGERISFEFNNTWLKENSVFLDTELQHFRGRQFPANLIFGFLSDASPDRWGRTLMDRREMLLAREEKRRPRKMQESDYLLGVYDEGRTGGLRFSYSKAGPFESSAPDMKTPPMVNLRALENAAISLEKDKNIYESKWLKMILYPGSSLGGARPKANVVSPEGDLWIAKFPSMNDTLDVGAWEMVAHDLAKKCGLNVPPAEVRKFSEHGSTYLVRRFDRYCKEGKQHRIHFASAMTMLGETDGTVNPVSYLDIAGVIEEQCREVEKNLREMWNRLLYTVLISNTDDHLRNHGFLLQNGMWSLSPAYDVNPTFDKEYLALNINEDSCYIDIETVLEVSEYFRIPIKEAKEIAGKMSRIINKEWRRIAGRYHITESEQDLMSSAFRESLKYL